jgi:hypothetical protein
MSEPDPRANADWARWAPVSVALFVAGLLILLLSGLCTGLGAWAILVDHFSRSEPVAVAIVLMVAVPGLAIGAALSYASLKSSTGNQGEPRWSGISLALFVVGVMILILAGLGTALLGMLGPSSEAYMALRAGPLCALLGAALVYAGLKTRRRS